MQSEMVARQNVTNIFFKSDIVRGNKVASIIINVKFCSQAVLDHETWVMNLKEANLYGYPMWRKLYSARDAYRLPSLMPEDWDDLITKFTEDDVLFELYYKYAFALSFVFSFARNAKLRVFFLYVL